MIKKATIPPNWTVIKISDVGYLIRGVNYNKEESTSFAKEGNIPILRANNINGELNFTELVYVPKKYINEEQIIQAGDILIAMSSGSKHLVGKSAKAKPTFSCSFGAFCAIFRVFASFSKSYIAYYFQSPYYKNKISRISKGTNINNLKKEHILGLNIPVPPYLEQQHIVENIEELFSELDAGRLQLETAKEQLKTYRQAVLKYAFVGRLTKKIDKESELPRNWKWLKVEDVGIIETGNTPSKKILDYYSNKYPFYKPTDLEAGYNVKYSADSLSEQGIKVARYLPANSILVTCIGATIGKTGIIRVAGACNQQINAIIPSSEFEPNYIYYQVIGPTFQDLIKRNASSTTLPILNKSKFMKLPIVHCPLNEQIEIVHAIESRLSICDNLEKTIDNCLQQTEVLKQSILKQAFEGKLVKPQIN